MNRLSDLLTGRYELMEQLGTTGLASVYRARDVRTNAVVALKVLHAYFAREMEVLEGYLQEVERLRGLRHPNIVAVHGVEKIGDMTAIVTDYVPWPNLKARDGRSLQLSQFLAVLRQVAVALDYALAQGILHGDLRPSNVFYNRETGEVTVSDWGTANLALGGHALVRTTVNTPAPGYSSPQVIQGEPPDPRDDIYSLGVLGYELLTGEIPFDALNPHTLLQRQLTSAPAPPSHLYGELPSAVDDAVLKALHYRPEERYSTCTEMVDALEKAVGPYTSVELPTNSRLERQEELLKTDRLAKSEALENEYGRVVCPNCGGGNPASATNCQNCWGKLVERPVMTPEEEQQYVRWYLAVARWRKRFSRSVLVGLVAVLVAVLAYNMLEIRPPLPAPSTTISSQSATGEWSMVQRDVRHTGVVPGPAFVPQRSVQWRFSSEGLILAPPSVADDRVYVATGDRRIVALDKTTGTPLWTHPVSGVVTGSPVIAGDMVFVGSRGGTLLALDAGTGDLRWSYDTKNPIYGSATVLDGALYIGSADRHLYSFDAQTGELRWRKELTDWVNEPPAISQGIIVIGAADGELFMIDASNGTLRNQLRVDPSSISGATLVDDVAYFVARSGNLIAYDYTQRDIPFQKAFWSIWLQFHIWKVAPLPSPPPGRLWGISLGDGVVADLATADGRLFAATVGGKLYAVELGTGQRLWESADLGNLSASPIVSGDTVIQAALDGTIHGLDVATGEPRWSVSVDGGVIASVALAGDTLYVPTLQGNLYAIR